MGENQGMVWLLLAFIGILAAGIALTNTVNIPAVTWFGGVTTIVA